MNPNNAPPLTLNSLRRLYVGIFADKVKNYAGTFWYS